MDDDETQASLDIFGSAVLLPLPTGDEARAGDPDHQEHHIQHHGHDDLRLRQPYFQKFICFTEITILGQKRTLKVCKSKQKS